MRCPTCHTEHTPPADAASAIRKLGPFCSARCQLIDLGQWLSEWYRIPDAGTPLSEAELEVVMSAREDPGKS